jgi:K+-sensing histidine kinase KdpD
VRGDEARNMDEAAGFGLGLSITNAIVLAHGGTLSLHDRQPHGLVVRMRLPTHQKQRPRCGLEDDDFSGRQAASASGCASS